MKKLLIAPAEEVVVEERDLRADNEEDFAEQLRDRLKLLKQLVRLYLDQMMKEIKFKRFKQQSQM